MIPLRDNIPSRKFPIINYLLIAANVALFFYQLTLASQFLLDDFIYSYGVVPVLLTTNPAFHWFSIFSSQFLHGGWMHLIGNMLYLYIFGDNVEDRFGHSNYLLFYLSCGVAAALAQIFFHPYSKIPMIGASGAIAGVLGAYFLFYPRARVLTLIPLGIFSRIIEIPAFLFLGFWFLMQTFSGTAALYTARAMEQDVGGVAWWAHAGGFVAGVLFALLLKIKRNLR